MMHHPHSPVERYHTRGGNPSPHVQHQQIDPNLGPQGGYDDPNMSMQQQQQQQQGGHPQQGGYMQHPQQQQQGPYEDEYMRR